MLLHGPTTDHVEIRRWAESRGSSPAECLPHRVDHIPPLLRFVPKNENPSYQEVRPVSWADFFARFDALGLAFAYNDDEDGAYEFLQVEARSPYRSVAYQLLPH